MRQVRAAHKALSPCDTALLQLLGVSSEAAVWFAGRLIQTAPTSASRRASDVAGNAKALLLALNASTAAAVPAQQQAPAQQQLNQQLLLLVPAMLLRWAAQASDSAAAARNQVDQEPPGLAAFLAALRNSRMTGRCAEIDKTVNTAVDCVRQWQQHIASSRSAGGDSTAAGSTAAAGSSVWLRPYLPAEWLQQVFPDSHAVNSTRMVAAVSSSAQIPAASPSALVVLQAELIAWAGAQPETEVGGSTNTSQDQLQQQQGDAAGASSTGSTCSSNYSWPQQPQQPLPAALAAFQGVSLQTIASFDSFARSAAQRIAATQRAVASGVEGAITSITGLYCTEDASRPGPLLALVQAAGPGSREQQAL
jgi:hypothetical protein